MDSEIKHNLKHLELPITSEEKVNIFIERWKNTKGKGAELADFQSFVIELCEALELPRPNPKSDATKNSSYIFERPVASFTNDGVMKNSKNRIDLYRKNCFVMEGKQSDKKIGSQSWNNSMQKAKNQADNYIRSLPVGEGRPPFIVIVDVGKSINIYSEFSCSGGIYVPFPNPRNDLIKLDDIANPNIQKRLQTLWLYPDALDPSKYAAEVTKEVSFKLAHLAKSLEDSGFEVERTAHFLKRCLFTMFSEDVQLIPEGSFTKLLEELKSTPEYFVDSMRNLWETMNKGGFEGQLRIKLPQFNGGLFANIDPISLNEDQIQLLIDAAKADWRYVEPAIFGTLLERALDPIERHKLGAHYTPRAYVERLVMPTVIEPLRKEWETVKVSVEMLLQKEKEGKALTILKEYHYRLCEIKILDPACGSGNFLYVALEHLKRLEGEVLNAMRDLSDGQTMLDSDGLMVDLQQFLGIEVSPRASAIAEIVLWIGFLQWHHQIYGKLDLPEPIIRDFQNIENRDAVLTYDSVENVVDDQGNHLKQWDGVSKVIHPVTGKEIPDESATIDILKYTNPRMADWPDSDFIIGNPPFIGNKRMRYLLGDGYAQALRDVYESSVPNTSDYVMYWWQKAAEILEKREIIQFGFITTNSVTQVFNRSVIENNLTPLGNLSLAFAIPDHPWVDSSDGAAVRIAMTCAKYKDKVPGELFTLVKEESKDDLEMNVSFKSKSGEIRSALTIGANIALTKNLRSNDMLASQGVNPLGLGFRLNEDELLSYGFLPNKLPQQIRPYLIGRDIVQKHEEKYVIDFTGLNESEAREKQPTIFQHILTNVKPERDHNRRKTRRENWWLFGENAPMFRKASYGIPRYIVTCRTAKHRLFLFTEVDTLPDAKIVAIALDDSYYLGILSSRIHTTWAMATGGWLGAGNDSNYNHSDCFGKFPMPENNSENIVAIRTLADELEQHRSNVKTKHPEITLTKMYNVIDKIRNNEPLNKSDKSIHEKALISTLLDIHDKLDTAVFEAYGWSGLCTELVGKPGSTSPTSKKTEDQLAAEDDLLARLVDLNQVRYDEEKQEYIRWLRSSYQSPETVQQNISIERVTANSKGKTETVKKSTWPKEMRDQIDTILELLSAPSSAEAIAANFKRKPIKQVSAVLDALEALGKAQKDENVWSLI